MKKKKYYNTPRENWILDEGHLKFLAITVLLLPDNISNVNALRLIFLLTN